MCEGLEVRNITVCLGKSGILVERRGEPCAGGEEVRAEDKPRKTG